MENSALPDGIKQQVERKLLELETTISQDAFPGKILPAVVKVIEAEGVKNGSKLESHDSNPPISCMFFCFPYLHLSDPGDFELPGIPRHSIRGLVQSLYRSESPLSRELQQAIRKLPGTTSYGIIHVPHFWGLIIDNRK